MLTRIVITGVVVAAMAVWWETAPVPDWALVVFVSILFGMAIVIGVDRFRAERALTRRVWNVLRGR
jgi:hypothetical protein